ncbi:hypothetical protein FS842_010410 [Serendipita sp. 407]|nr:hypothetical protein FS842_010410 [Serendipita sp. 407]
MLTFAVREKINILYFDGSSASNSLMGHLDSQDVLLWGKVRPEKLLDEVGRIRSLCAWGAPFGLDGYVRMEPGFELMLCDFSKLRLVSSVRIHAPDRSKERGWNTRDDHGFGSIFQRRAIRRSNSVLLPPGGPPSREPPGLPPIPPPPPPVPPNWRGPFRTGHSVEIETCLAAAWNNFYPGEARVKLDYTRMVSFYDPSLMSLLPSRDGLPKNRHRLVTLSKDDAKLAMDRLEDDLNRKSGDPSTDWSMLLRTVMDRYGDRLWLLRDTLSSPERYDSIKLAAEQVRLQVFVMLTPYLVYDAVPDEDSPTGGKDHSWVKPIIHRCSTSLTAGVEEAQLFRSEKLIKRATDGVLRRICSTIAEIWADAMPVSMASEHRTHRLIGSWKRDVDVLMTWLDWPMWQTCHPACPPQMFCYIPTWPWGVEWTEMDPDDIDMAPRCIDRTTGSLILPRF